MEITNEPGELELLEDANQRALRYLSSINDRQVFPGPQELAGLQAFDEPLPEAGASAAATLALLDNAGTPATVTSNGPHYYGFVVGASLPVAAAAERLALAWDQCAASFDNSPTVDKLETLASRWVLETLRLPPESAVGFGTSATACGLACLATARRTLLDRLGWDFDQDGLTGAPEIRVVVPQSVHITMKKALRLLGFGLRRLVFVPIDDYGRMDPTQLPALDGKTILCLQAGEVNTGEFDLFLELIPRARDLGAWIHIDGAFGLWARASRSAAHLADGADGADSWTADGHKWLNTPYDGAMAICRHADEMAATMNADAAYFTASKFSQKNLTLEFSRRARGVAVWAALRTLGLSGVEEMVDRHRRQAQRLAEGLRNAGYTVLNRVVLNQVLARCDTDEQTVKSRAAALQDGEIWFGTTVWQGRPAFRMSISSWRTTDADVDRAIRILGKAQAA
jgi:glutamate/tyrosine decarboxylase-like PLP-dependent enzyme